MEWFQVLPSTLRTRLERLPSSRIQGLEEVRLRANRPLSLVYAREDLFLAESGELTPDWRQGWVIPAQEVQRTLHMMVQGSLYAREEEMRQGYLTLKGGHRVGLVGQVLVDRGRIEAIKHIAGLNIRVAREVLGVATPLVRHILRGGSLGNTLVVGAPRSGKTTLLRDLIRQLSQGVGGCHYKVGVVDERSEIGASYQGVPQMDLGPRTDVLDGCPKSIGVMLLIRALSPDLIVTDELGGEEEVKTLTGASLAGVRLITSIHAGSLEEAYRRPGMEEALRMGAFRWACLLGRNQGPGTIEAIEEVPVISSPLGA